MNLKPRLDELLVQRGLFDDVRAAQAAVLAGEVIVGEHRETSAGKRLKPDVPIRVKSKSQFVSRGGKKLAAALQAFPVEVAEKDCADLGCSSGGFTDCLLQNGAAHVTAVDVGRAQFDWALRNDARVSLFERTNVRGIDVQAVGGPFDIAVADLSFIRLERVMQDVQRLLKDGGIFISLVKPQFEVAKDEVGENGVVRSADLHKRVIAEVLRAAEEHGLQPQGLTYSPITGPEGNIEFLFWAQSCPTTAEKGSSITENHISSVVDQAHAKLGG